MSKPAAPTTTSPPAAASMGNCELWKKRQQNAGKRNWAKNRVSANFRWRRAIESNSRAIGSNLHNSITTVVFLSLMFLFVYCRLNSEDLTLCYVQSYADKRWFTLIPFRAGRRKRRRVRLIFDSQVVEKIKSERGDNYRWGSSYRFFHHTPLVWAYTFIRRPFAGLKYT